MKILSLVVIERLSVDSCATLFLLQVQELVGKTVEKGPNYFADPSGLRTGNPPDEGMAEVLQQEASKLEEYISKVVLSEFASNTMVHLRIILIIGHIYLSRIKFKRKFH